LGEFFKLELNLDFSGDNTRYATHGLHSYAAKCPPQLVKYGLDTFSQPGDVVLDSMAGSGTTLVESKIHKRNAIGFDIDPLACLIARVKSRILDDDQIEYAASLVLSAVTQDNKHLQSGTSIEFSPEVTTLPNFPNRDYWFSKSVQQNLALLSYHIQHAPIQDEIREFLWVAFSGIILAKVSVANARDIIHSRHHYFAHPEPPDVLNKFEKRIKMMRRQMSEFRRVCGESSTTVDIRQADARQLPLEDDSVDLVFTSPPYATALDYPRALFLAVNWMQSVLETSHSEYKEKGKSYIGSERGTVGKFLLDENISESANITISQLTLLDKRKAFLVQRYFQDMQKVISEMGRVLKAGKFAVIVVCPSHIRKVAVPTHTVFNELAASAGLNLISEHLRTIDSGKRLLPHVRGEFGNRMSTEYVLIYQKG
jgi:DNA modification methylase